MLFAPLAIATFAGAMTAPFTQRGVPAIAFPVLVFAAMTLMSFAGPHHDGPDIRTVEMAASCAGPAGMVFIW
jgi:hypothetical protein